MYFVHWFWDNRWWIVGQPFISESKAIEYALKRSKTLSKLMFSVIEEGRSDPYEIIINSKLYKKE